MNETPALAEHVLFKVGPFIDEAIASKHLRLESAYRDRIQNKITEIDMCCMLAEIVALKDFKAKLEREAKKNQKIP